MDHQNAFPRVIADDKMVRRLASFVFALVVTTLVVFPFGPCGLASTENEEEPHYEKLFGDLHYFLKEYYLDLSRSKPRYLLRRALTSLENAADEVYVDDSNPNDPHIIIHLDGHSIARSLNKVESLEDVFKYLTDIFNNFLQKYYDNDRPLNEVRYATANGLLSGLDPHTLVFSPKAFKEFYVHIEGEIFGVGMLVGVRKGALRVIQVLKDTPAKRAGFKNGDIIYKIGDESTINMSVNEAVQMIRGPRGSEITLTVKRRTGEDKKLKTIDVPVVRDRVVIKSVVSKLLPNSVGYVEVNNYDKNTVSSLRLNLENLQVENDNQPLKGLVLDLRRNSGGLLKQASEMSDLFLTSGELYAIADRKDVTEHKGADDETEPTFPIVMLCSEHSASGAEIVIGALQQNDRAVVLGLPTFGKGSVQQLHPLRRLGGEFEPQLKITVSEYLIPGQISIQENGVIPDIEAQTVTFSDKHINLFPDTRRGTEKDYKHHIVSKYAREIEPAERLQYPYIFTEQEEEFGDEFMSGDIKPEDDSLVKIALELLGMAKVPFSRKEFLATQKDGIDAIRKRQFDEIVGLLKERDIDWSDGKNPQTKPEVAINLTHEFVERPSNDEDDPYPEKVLFLRAKLTNESSDTLYRVSATTKSDYFLYHEREFLFGRIEPGQTLERSIESIIYPTSATRSDVFSAQVSVPGFEDPVARVDHEVALQGADFPEFTYALTLLDASTKTPIKHLKPGVDATVVAEIKNIGKRAMKKGVTVLRKEPGDKAIFLQEGRVDIENFEPGETREIEFRFQVRDDAELELYEFEFAVADSHYPAGLSRAFVISGKDSQEGKDGIRNGHWFKQPDIQAVSVLSSPRHNQKDSVITDQDSIMLGWNVSDQTPVKAWITTTPVSLESRAQTDKIFFAKSDAVDGPLQLMTPVPLNIGQNLITLVAKNEDGLVRRKILFARREPVKTVGVDAPPAAKN